MYCTGGSLDSTSDAGVWLIVSLTIAEAGLDDGWKFLRIYREESFPGRDVLEINVIEATR